MSQGLGIVFPFPRVRNPRPLSAVCGESCCHSCDTTATIAKKTDGKFSGVEMMTWFVFPKRKNGNKRSRRERRLVELAACQWIPANLLAVLVPLGSIPAKRERVRLLRRPKEAGLGAVGAQGPTVPVPQNHALPQDDSAHGGYGEALVDGSPHRSHLGRLDGARKHNHAIFRVNWW